ncbi:hypothetical protein F441_20312 [Phytophthora nicotianae CJ01A1]|uniref:Uncharacterized protein n=3 Tax=Phytophthora nicotianae TaxID=4792 RepID=W2Y9B7_PHYNI|nr:hypothetical protein L915_19875 [Phytophthora nicotianae]ETP02609.1 hypothetical protein F441_20312 [Phytophthora nicotianae CJ01A1]ETP30789.1 hypothetical protein F442_20249 [Phytophthora nicotianae P10297]
MLIFNRDSKRTSRYTNKLPISNITMGKPTDRDVAADKEFATLAQVLIETANDAENCLKLLKRKLAEYDGRHGNRFVGTAKSYMRSDLRNAKDVSADLRHVAHKITKKHKNSKKEVHSARKHMNATSNALDILKTTARNYDEKHGHAKKDNYARADLHDGRHHGGVLGSSDTVEELVKTTLRDNVNLNVLSYQINSADKSVSSPSIVERAKEAMHGMKEKLTGDKSSPTRRHSMTP